MRKGLLIIAAFLLVTIGSAYIWACRAPGLPSASVKLIGYESKADSLVATVELTNTGTSPLSYEDTSRGVRYSVMVRVQGKATNLNSGGGLSSMSGPMVIWPSSSARISIAMPAGTESWHCEIPVQGTGARIRVFERLGKSGIWNRTHPASQGFIRLFPLNDSEVRQIQSETFVVGTNGLRL